MTLTESTKFMVAMIIMMNPLGSLTIFIDLTRRMSISTQRKISIKIYSSIIIMMLVTLWLGHGLLDLLGISISSFRFAGGIILLLIGLSMLQSKESPVNYTIEDDEAAKEKHGSIAVVPMSLPVIVGPGAMSALIIAAGDHPDMLSKSWLSLLCLVLASGVTLLLYYAAAITRFMGMSLIMVITRIMGMIIMAIAVGMLAEGLAGLFPLLLR